MPNPIQIERPTGTIWRVRFRLAGISTSRTFLTEHDAQWFCDQIDTHGTRVALHLLETYETEASDGFERDKSPYFDAVAKEFFEWKRHRVRDEKTVDDYEGIYDRALKRPFGARPIASINVEDIEAWIDLHVTGKIKSARTGKPLSNKTIRDRHNVLSQILAYAADPRRSYIRTNPAKAKIDLPKRIKPTPKGLMPMHWQALESKMRELGYADAADLATFLLGSGWRIGEAMALYLSGIEDYGPGAPMWVTMNQVSRRGTVVEAEGKAQHSMRRIKLDPATADIVRERCRGKRHNDHVFTQANGTPWTHRQFGAILERCAREAGLPHMTAHTFRHTHVAWLAMSNAPLAELQRRIGHASITTTLGVYGGMIGDVGDGTLDAFAAMRDTTPRLQSRPKQAIESTTV